MTPPIERPRRKLPFALILFAAMELALLGALIGSGFWEGGVKGTWKTGYVIGTLTHGCVSLSHWNFSHMTPTFWPKKTGVELNGNAIVPDENRPTRWTWTPNLYKSKNPSGPQVHALRTPLWLLALLPLGALLWEVKARRAARPSR